jgi:hypothetical protein
VQDMFSGTQCPVATDPDLSTGNSFCAVCTTGNNDNMDVNTNTGQVDGANTNTIAPQVDGATNANGPQVDGTADIGNTGVRT